MSENSNEKPVWPLYVICYGALIAMTVLSAWLLQGLAQALSHIGILLDFNRYVMTVLNQWSFVVFGIFWLIAIFWIEHYLREGIKNGTLWSRIGKVLAWEASLFALVFGIQMIPIG